MHPLPTIETLIDINRDTTQTKHFSITEIHSIYDSANLKHDEQGSICGETRGVSSIFLTKPEEGQLKLGGWRNQRGLNPPTNRALNESYNFTTYNSPLTLWMTAIWSSIVMFSRAFWATFSIEAVWPSQMTLLFSFFSSSPICPEQIEMKS